jgi:phospholipid/cholesterol/gamma-HCH transport system permease protein
MLPLLTIAANSCGIFMGWLANTFAEPISLHLFLERGFRQVAFSDYIPPVAKAAVFGWIIGLVACFQGMRTKGGTEGVGKSATSSVVIASLFVILADVVICSIRPMMRGSRTGSC